MRYRVCVWYTRGGLAGLRRAEGAEVAPPWRPPSVRAYTQYGALS